jgi:hypothetical protein
MKVVLAFLISFSFGFTLIAQSALWQKYFDLGTIRQVVPVSENQNEGYFMAYEYKDCANSVKVLRTDSAGNIVWEKEIKDCYSTNDGIQGNDLSANQLKVLKTGNLFLGIGSAVHKTPYRYTILDRNTGEELNAVVCRNVFHIDFEKDSIEAYMLHDEPNGLSFYFGTRSTSVIVRKFDESQVYDLYRIERLGHQSLSKDEHLKVVDTIDHISGKNRSFFTAKVVGDTLYSIHKTAKTDSLPNYHIMRIMRLSDRTIVYEKPYDFVGGKFWGYYPINSNELLVNGGLQYPDKDVFRFDFYTHNLAEEASTLNNSLYFLGYKSVSNVIKHHDSWVFLLNKEKSGAMYLYNDGYERVFSRSFEDFSMWNINNVFFEEDGYIITGSRNGKAHVIKYPYNTLLRDFYTSQRAIENQVVDIKVYPNPARSQFFLENTAGANKLKLFDLQGRLLWQQSIQSNRALIVPPSELNGMYILQVMKEDAVLHNQKLLILP